MTDRSRTRVHLDQKRTTGGSFQDEIEANESRKAQALHHMLGSLGHVCIIEYTDDCRWTSRVSGLDRFETKAGQYLSVPAHYGAIRRHAQYEALQSNTRNLTPPSANEWPEAKLLERSLGGFQPAKQPD